MATEVTKYQDDRGHIHDSSDAAERANARYDLEDIIDQAMVDGGGHLHINSLLSQRMALIRCLEVLA